MAEQTANRGVNGQFVKGNKIGNRFKPGESGNPNGRNGAMSDLFKERKEMPKGKGSYGRKVGSPAKKSGGKSKRRKKTSYGY